MPRPLPLAAALTATALAAVTASPASAATSHWKLTYDINASRTLGNVSNGLASVAALGPRDVWLAGSWDNVARDFSAIQHFDGRRWRNTPLPAALTSKRNTESGVDEVSASSSGNVWAFASTATNADGRMVHALRWNGRAWTVQHTWKRETSLFTGVTFGAKDTWAFGDGGLGAWHFNGSTWRKVPTPGTIEQVSGVSSKNIWATTGRSVLHYDGRTWRAVKIGSGALDIRAVSARTASDVWAVGGVRSGTTETPVAFHWNGRSWTKYAGPRGKSAKAPLVAAVADGRGGAWLSRSSTVGGTDLFHLVKGKWVAQSPPKHRLGRPYFRTLAAIPHSPALWAIGVIEYGPAPFYDTVVYSGTR
ncbi:hypothetical protein [Actinomadura rupiterrae]|uniref:hypothetical protein n=1 Tax=Actinomadura rupiterrae TaxID=559627 RepID=UPI0020A4AEEA|nr:hypothetical protein [Actinomadura rupiterrae]MCP2343465.1 hypothetical protein [Actinomadura rupiterrae]